MQADVKSWLEEVPSLKDNLKQIQAAVAGEQGPLHKTQQAAEQAVSDLQAVAGQLSSVHQMLEGQATADGWLRTLLSSGEKETNNRELALEVGACVLILGFNGVPINPVPPPLVLPSSLPPSSLLPRSNEARTKPSGRRAECARITIHVWCVNTSDTVIRVRRRSSH